MNKRLGTLAAAVVLTAVAEISSAATRPLPVPRPCPSIRFNSKPCTMLPQRMPPAPAPQQKPPNGTRSH